MGILVSEIFSLIFQKLSKTVFRIFLAQLGPELEEGGLRIGLINVTLSDQVCFVRIQHVISSIDICFISFSLLFSESRPWAWIFMSVCVCVYFSIHICGKQMLINIGGSTNFSGGKSYFHISWLYFACYEPFGSCFTKTKEKKYN